MDQWHAQQGSSAPCPLCRAECKEAELLVAPAEQEANADAATGAAAPSSKTAALLSYLEEHSGEEGGEHTRPALALRDCYVFLLRLPN